MGNSDHVRADDEIARLRKALEAEEQRSVDLQKQLDRANRDFEEFVSMGAHNLRESLRDVAAYSQLIAETSAGRLDSDAGVFLNRIQEGASRAQSLVAAAVDYWATGAGNRQFSRTNMEGVLSQALLLAEKQIVERSAIVTHEPLPAITGHFDTLAKVLRHLIGNAIEYCEATPPRVHVSAKRADPDWVFSVQDNGPGIDPAFQGRLFGVFKRLHGKEHPGNGLGLAFCKRAIEWLGGRMWMESAPGTGSTFYFALPPAD